MPLAPTNTEALRVQGVETDKWRRASAEIALNALSEQKTLERKEGELQAALTQRDVLVDAVAAMQDD
eukprot:39313-Eustigmatos_ZCMA.PRE.1